MPDPVPVESHMQDITKHYHSAPKVFDMLMDCMTIQPELDPESGYGVFTAATIYDTLDFAEDEGTLLVERLDGNVTKFYLLMRGAFLLATDKQELCDFIQGMTDFDFDAILGFVCLQAPKFNRKLAQKGLSG